MIATGKVRINNADYELVDHVLHVDLFRIGSKYKVDIPEHLTDVNEAVQWYHDQIEKVQREVKLRPQPGQTSE